MDFLITIIVSACTSVIVTKMFHVLNHKEITEAKEESEVEKNKYIKNSVEHLDAIMNKPFTIKDKPSDVLPKIDEEVEVVK